MKLPAADGTAGQAAAKRSWADRRRCRCRRTVTRGKLLRARDANLRLLLEHVLRRDAHIVVVRRARCGSAAAARARGRPVPSPDRRASCIRTRDRPRHQLPRYAAARALAAAHSSAPRCSRPANNSKRRIAMAARRFVARFMCVMLLLPARRCWSASAVAQVGMPRSNPCSCPCHLCENDATGTRPRRT